MTLTYKAIVLAISVMMISTSQAYEWETQGAVGYYFPSDGLWDNGWSGEAKIIAWEDNLGIALSGGMMQWDVESKKNVIIDNSSQTKTQTWNGDVQYFPLGISVLQRFDLEEDMDNQKKLQVEAGLHYLFGSDNLEIIQTDKVLVGPGSTYSTTYLPVSASCDDALVVRVGGSYQWTLNEQTFALVSGGYQFDITQGDATASSINVKQELDLSAFYIHFGVGFMWK